MPTLTASQVATASGANHTVISPRWTSARSYAGQFPTWYFALYFRVYSPALRTASALSRGERIAAPRESGVEGRFAGRALRPGMEREIALNVLSQLGASVGGNPVGAGVHDPRAGAPTVGVAALGTPGLTAA